MTKFFGGFWEVSRVLASALIIAAAMNIAGCASRSWIKYPVDREPDFSCQTGGEAGYDVYIWDCLNQEHVVVYQWQAGLYRWWSAKVEKVPCRQLTEFEKRMGIGDRVSRRCDSQPQLWKHSPR